MSWSLHAALQHPCSAQKNWLEALDHDHCHLSLTSSEHDSLYWVDKHHEKHSLAFPAILDLNGPYNCFGPYFNLSDHENIHSFHSYC